MYHCITVRLGEFHRSHRMPPIIQEAGVETRGGSPGPEIFMVTIMKHGSSRHRVQTRSRHCLKLDIETALRVLFIVVKYILTCLGQLEWMVNAKTLYAINY